MEIFWYISSYISLSDDCHVKICKFTALSSGPFCQIYRVSDEALIAEAAVWPNFFLMNVFFALKGSKLFIIIISRFVWLVTVGCTHSLLKVVSYVLTFYRYLLKN